MTDLVCASCGEPVVTNVANYKVFEQMHWICFHYVYEHSLGGSNILDRDTACADPSCPVRALDPHPTPSWLPSAQPADTRFLQQFRDWFAQGKKSSLELPDGWFGRPHDNMHRLTWSAWRDGKVFVELDSQLHLILSDPELTTIKAERLEVQCTQLVLDRRDFGPAGARAARVFATGGAVSFHAHAE